MKLLIRYFGLIVFTLFIILIILYFNNTNYMINEMHISSYLAIEEAMNKEIKYLKGDIEDINLKEEVIESFNNLVKNDDNYVLNVEADKNFGIVKLNVSPKRKYIKDINLTNIIEHYVTKQEEKGLDEFDVKAFSQKTRIDNILYFKEFDEPKLLKSFYIDVEAYTKTNGESVFNRYEPEMKITLIDENDKTHIYTKAPVVGKETLNEVNFNSANYDFEPMKVKSVELFMLGISKNAAPKADILRVGSTKKNYFEYEGKYIEDHTLYSRYIDETYKPIGDSLWLTNNYQNVLREYTK